MYNTEEQPKTKKGGKRANSGRKPKYGEPTKVFQMRVPESKMYKLKKAVNLLLNEDWLDRFLHEFDAYETD